MKNSSLQLKKYFFPLIIVGAQSDFSKTSHLIDEKYASFFCPLDCIIIEKQVRVNNNNPRLFQVDLRIESGEDHLRPYQFALQCIGEFEVINEMPEDDMLALVAVNAASVLYSACRELLIDQTSKSAYGPMILPTVAFEKLVHEKHFPENVKPLTETSKEEYDKQGLPKKKKQPPKPKTSAKK